MVHRQGYSPSYMKFSRDSRNRTNTRTSCFSLRDYICHMRIGPLRGPWGSGLPVILEGAKDLITGSCWPPHREVTTFSRNAIDTRYRAPRYSCREKSFNRDGYPPQEASNLRLGMREWLRTRLFYRAQGLRQRSSEGLILGGEPY
jgi:hypothetical protein